MTGAPLTAPCFPQPQREIVMATYDDWMDYFSEFIKQQLAKPMSPRRTNQSFTQTLDSEAVMQVTDEMVRVAAEALWNYDGDGRPFSDSSDELKEYWLNASHAALTAALAAMWRPIEDAPKDGTEVLVAGGTFYNSTSTFTDDLPFIGPSLACWDDYCREWRGENSGGHDEFFYYKPTHFMPLPSPPKAEG
jgi:hypothetical protein